MKSITFLFAAKLLMCLNLSAQSTLQNSNWIFGSNAHLEFNSTGIIPKNTIFFSSESCATVSNPKTGELIFYSNGVTAMDKNGNMLLNGDSLKGSVTSSQGTLILPDPNSEFQYLLFTTPSAWAVDKGLYYSVLM